MLAGPGDPYGYVQVRRYYLARQAHLLRGRRPPKVHNGPRCRGHAFKNVGQLLDKLKVLRAAQAFATGHDDLAEGRGEGLLGLRRLQLEGKRTILAGEFLRGYPAFPGARLPS